jgi:RNase H-fold protein (predicted Holliday junction resolvase)
MSAQHLVIGIDPGRTKCGLAVLTNAGQRVAIDVVPTAALAGRLQATAAGGDVAAICVGHATTSDAVVEMCRERWPQIPLVVVDESNTTLEARRRYYRDHPPRGLLRFVPRGLLVPSVPLDGYAALLIAERYLVQNERIRGPTPREPGLYKRRI